MKNIMFMVLIFLMVCLTIIPSKAQNSCGDGRRISTNPDNPVNEREYPGPYLKLNRGMFDWRTQYYPIYSNSPYHIGTDAPEQALNVIGNVQIGSDYFQPALPQSLSYRLSVDGQIVAKEFLCDAAQGNWADFLFDEEYQLLSLNELENYIKKEKHLPGIPKESDVISKGVDLVKMQTKLLKKIEELTLYIIAQQKEIDFLKNELINK